MDPLEGDTIMAEKGFDIASDLPHGVRLNIPLFLRNNSFISVKDKATTASMRVHVERAIARMKKHIDF